MSKKVLFILAAVIVIVALIGCSQSSPAPATTAKPTTSAPATTAPAVTGTIKIGALFELTGGLAPLGDESQKALQATFDVLGKTVAGKNVQVIIEDTASDPSGTLDKARKLVETDKVAMLWGPVHAGHRLGLAGYLDRAQIPDIAIAGDVDETILKHNWMWAMGNQSQMSYPSGQYAADQGYKTATVIGEDRSVGQEFLQRGFMPAFKEKGGTIIQEQYYPSGTQDFTPFIVNMKPADVIAAWIGDAAGFAGFPQLKKAGNKMPIIQVENGGIILYPGAAPQLGDSIYGIVTTAMYLNSMDTPYNKQFVAAYKARFNVLPGPFAGMMFRTVQISYEALKNTNGDTDPQKLAVALNKPIDTICGHIEWTPQHDSIMPVHLVKIDNTGTPQLIKTNIVTADKVGDTLVAKIIK